MWKLSASDRLEHWKRFRKEIDKLEFETALDRLAQFWGGAPFQPFYLESQQPETWPDPWTLIVENCYCDLAKALGILYTLHLSVHKTHDYSLVIMRQQQTRYLYNLVWIDNGKYVLNLDTAEVVNKKSIPDNLVKIIEYTKPELNLDRF